MNFDLETRPDIENIKEPREFNSILIGKKNTFVQYSTSIVLVPISLTVTAITPPSPPKKKLMQTVSVLDVPLWYNFTY